MRRRLVAYFARKRSPQCEELADETLNRVSRRLEEEGAITDAPPARYCYIVARFVFLESLRTNQPGHFQAGPDLAVPDPAADTLEPLLHCLDRCLVELKAADRELILGYYDGAHDVKIRHRRELAARLALSANALTIRACRIRDRLEACVSSCGTGR
jgi:DNA-directed RNA polymerase specialized sigma24 family protein